MSFEPKIVGILCKWCSYAGADLAGTSRKKYSPNVRVVRVMCSGRVEPMFVLKALEKGADGVLILGCHPGDCHYQEGNYKTLRRFALLKKVLSQLGVEDERVRLEWVSASEADRYAKIVDDMTEKVKKLLNSFKNVVSVGFYRKAVSPYVYSDNYLGAYQAVEYLIKKGRKKIIHISENNCDAGRDRNKGYIKALEGFILSVRSGDERDFYNRPNNGKTLDIYIKEFKEFRKFPVRTQFDQGYFSAWTDILQYRINTDNA